MASPALPGGLGGGTFLGRPFTPRTTTDENLDRKEPRFAATYNGFDGHGEVRLAADDDEGRERLIRYCARPPFAATSTAASRR